MSDSSIRRSAVHQLAITENNEVRKHAIDGRRRLVNRTHDVLSTFLTQTLNVLHDATSGRRIQTRSRFIKKQQSRVRKQFQRNAQAFALTGGNALVENVAHLRVRARSQSHSVNHVLNTSFSLHGGHVSGQTQTSTGLQRL